jgi:putative two-component system response regulator
MTLASTTIPGQAHNQVPHEQAATLLLVDAVPSSRRSVRNMLQLPQYNIVECASAAEAIEYIAQERVDVILTALSLPGMSGMELCRWMKANRDTQLIPILVLTSAKHCAQEIQARLAGADEFISKPVHPELLRARIASMLRTKTLTDSLEKAESILFALAQAVEERDLYTGEHCHRLAVYSVALGKAAGVPHADRLALYRGGYLHDIGKISIPDSILFKPGALTAEEWAIMRRHTIKGEEICRPMRSLADVLPIIRSHHERWDGSGYPDGLRRDEIPLLARVLQICDIYDALTSVRCYKPALSHDQAIEVLRAETRRGWRDPDLVDLFIATCRHPFPGIMLPTATDLSGMLSMHHSITDPLLELAPLAGVYCE